MRHTSSDTTRHMVWIPTPLWNRIYDRLRGDQDLGGGTMPMSRAIIMMLDEACARRERSVKRKAEKRKAAKRRVA